MDAAFTSAPLSTGESRSQASAPLTVVNGRQPEVLKPGTRSHLPGGERPLPLDDGAREATGVAADAVNHPRRQRVKEVQT